MSAHGAEPVGLLERAARAFRGQGDRRNGEAAIIRDAAVVDVGSNSVRLVIYRIEGRAILPLLNESAAPALGRDLRVTGKLAPDAVQETLDALARFRLYIESRGVRDVSAVATAAARMAADGPDFLAHAQRVLGAPIRVLTGAEEGRYAALGVLAADPGARGVVGDLGGASLELAQVGDGGAGDGITFPLGPFSIPPEVARDRRAAQKFIDDQLTLIEPAQADGAATFFAVGGAWRNLARVEMHRRPHPILSLHSHEMTAAQLAAVVQFVWKQKPGALTRTPGVSKKRADSLPVASLVLERLVKRFDFQRVVISAYGVREGILFEQMSEPERAGDPLIAGAAAMARRSGAEGGFGAALEAWLEPVHAAIGTAFGSGRDPLLYRAASRLADIGGRQHPEHRAELAFGETLFANFVGLSHPERAFLARAMFLRYSSGRRPRDLEGSRRLLDAQQSRTAYQLGQFLRFACDLTGRASRLLEQTRIAIAAGDTLVLTLSGETRALATDEMVKRFHLLAKECGCTARIDYV